MVYIVADGPLANFAVNSLKQLQAAADKGLGVVVAAQFAAPERKIRRLIFDGTDTTGAFDRNKGEASKLPADTDMANSNALADFIKWVHGRPECNQSEHYCLVLWGHGPELLFEPPVTSRKLGSVATASYSGSPTAAVHSASPQIHEGKETSLYFTPVQLANALRKAGKKIDIIGLDACSMSMIEFAYELSGLTDFMVASQEEVPDFSFPYSALLRRFGDHKATSEEVCKATIQAYEEAYADYIFNTDTDTAPVTLSALNLGKINTIANPLKSLVAVLKSSRANQDVANAIYEARRQARGFVGGLFVDLCDFCDKLASESDRMQAKPKQAGGEASTVFGQLIEACSRVSLAINPPKHAATEGCIVANAGKHRDVCHGLSLYFPYLQDDHDRKQVERHLVKGPGGDTIGKGPGGDTIGKGPGGDTIGKNVSIINTAATSVLYAVRREIIKNIEHYYKDDQFKFAEEIDWYKFIVRDWSRILAEKEPDDLDLRYSAQQCAQNLLPLSGEPKATHAEDKKEPPPKGAEPPPVPVTKCEVCLV